MPGSYESIYRIWVLFSAKEQAGTIIMRVIIKQNSDLISPFIEMARNGIGFLYAINLFSKNGQKKGLEI